MAPKVMQVLKAHKVKKVQLEIKDLQDLLVHKEFQVQPVHQVQLAPQAHKVLPA